MVWGFDRVPDPVEVNGNHPLNLQTIQTTIWKEAGLKGGLSRSLCLEVDGTDLDRFYSRAIFFFHRVIYGWV